MLKKYLLPPLFLLFSLLFFAQSCIENPDGGGVKAYVVQHNAQLIGGPLALGVTGDYILENSKVRILVAKHGISRAFGVYGGNIIDADRVRSGLGLGDSMGAFGKDSLVEFFPTFFLASADTRDSKVIQDGSDGKEAIVRVSGQGASFIALTEKLNDFLTFMSGSNHLQFDMDYILRPNQNYIELKVTISNPSDSTYSYNGLGVVPSVAGMIGVFGKRNQVFVPGIAGYNIRFALEKVFKTVLKPPALPGLVGDFVGSHGSKGLNYGIVAAKSPENYVIQNQEEYKKLGVPLSESSILVPLEGSSITACFGKKLPNSLKSKASVSFSYFIIIGDGSVSSIRDAQLEIHKKSKGTVGGLVLESKTRKPVKNARVMAYTGNGTTPGSRVFYSDFVTDENGMFQGSLEPGTYWLQSRLRNQKSISVKVQVVQDQRVQVNIEQPLDSQILFTIRDEKGLLLPAKIAVLNKVKDFEQGRCVGKNPMDCLFDPHLDDPHLFTDYRKTWTCSDGKDCQTSMECKGIGDEICRFRLGADTEFRESYAVTSTGTGKLHLRPGKYRVVASRGIEYELGIQNIEIVEGEVKTLDFVLKHSAPTPTMVSSDLHVHTNLSHDSSIDDTDRIITFVAEGVDHFVTTDHNRIRDMYPLVQALKMERFLKTTVGLELTTFEMGHFNAFPLKLSLTDPTGGTPVWFKEETLDQEKKRVGIPPKEIFQKLRELGSLGPDKVILQVNHPRDSIMGYFETFNVSADQGVPVYRDGFSTPNSLEFSISNYDDGFNSIEVYNGKRMDQIWHWRIPLGFMIPAGYGGNGGNIIRIDEDGKAKVAWPGNVDDWFVLLNRGRKLTATANSDTHGHSDEAGLPRNYFMGGFDSPLEMTDQKLYDLMMSHRSFMTNGPLLTFQACAGTCDSAGSFKNIGDTLQTKEKQVTLRIKVRSASWVDVSSVVIFKNGKYATSLDVKKEENKPLDFSKDIQMDVSDGDAWFVVIARGSKDLWPWILPVEVEPFQIAQAVSLVQDSMLKSLPIKLASSDNACLMPSQTNRIYPLALTNPIWVDTDGDGKYTANPCKHLGTRGIRCGGGGTCVKGDCMTQVTCQKDIDCGKENRCVDGKCTESPCDGITCSKAFQKCDDSSVCANDQCSDNNKRCKDGNACESDGSCKDGSLCRYCACPAPRKACKDGKACSEDKDCASGDTCEARRFCYPTACSVGHCEPVYPICQPQGIQFSENKDFLTKSSSLGQSTGGLQSTKKKDFPMFQSLKKDSFRIEKIKPYLFFFDHKKH